MMRTLAASRWSGLGRRNDPRPRAKTKTFYERKKQDLSVPPRNPASRWSGLGRRNDPRPKAKTKNQNLP